MPKHIQGSTARIIITGNQAAKIYSGNDENFIREFNVLQRLGKHTNVVEMLDVQDRTIILQAGRCLREMLQEGDISHEQQEKWVCGLARGLQYVHDNNVIHADLNAANVIVSGDDIAMWIDFGGSQLDDQEALANYDEYSYRPPEHPDAPVNRATDIFAFGCTVFEIETGAPPFYHETKHMSQDGRISYVEDMYRQQLFPSVENLRFRSIIMCCWQGQYESMSALKQDLDSMGVQRSKPLSWYDFPAMRMAIRNGIRRLWPCPTI
ncbi:hypothetical protein LTR84_012803 [Exophiala bonariae]|uniref:Protein kinase domain-containing protein n=1 Tax=Exophiala bonariae TaxID=1690606 RepID=A0AAV9MRG5_9EURO|nr:hypothetical protein LTR84_012803 [Exophiala bonariae]